MASGRRGTKASADLAPCGEFFFGGFSADLLSFWAEVILSTWTVASVNLSHSIFDWPAVLRIAVPPLTVFLIAAPCQSRNTWHGRENGFYRRSAAVTLLNRIMLSSDEGKNWHNCISFIAIASNSLPCVLYSPPMSAIILLPFGRVRNNK